jgi:hypothetical protein
MPAEAIAIEAAGREVRLSNPGKVFFPKRRDEPKRVQPSPARKGQGGRR